MRDGYQRGDGGYNLHGGVPVNITDEMVDAGAEAIKECHRTGSFGECPGIGWGEARACLEAAFAADPRNDGDMIGYREAWYEICGLLDIPAMAVSPKQVHESVVMPKLRQLLGSKP
jgi:hypothetical protein